MEKKKKKKKKWTLNAECLNGVENGNNFQHLIFQCVIAKCNLIFVVAAAAAGRAVRTRKKDCKRALSGSSNCGRDKMRRVMAFERERDAVLCRN